jgi:hypothetical protein
MNWVERIERPSCSAFFEQQDFRAVGQALGNNEDAARMTTR